MFQLNSKVYFGRGPMEFVGIVLSSNEEKVVVSGVETGCLALQRMTVEIQCVKNLSLLSDEEFSSRTLNEPAFADMMSKDHFVQLQSELDGLEKCATKESADVNFRIHEIKLLLEHSPWHQPANSQQK